MKTGRLGLLRGGKDSRNGVKSRRRPHAPAGDGLKLREEWGAVRDTHALFEGSQLHMDTSLSNNSFLFLKANKQFEKKMKNLFSPNYLCAHV